jgi:hypothetical protein
VFFLTKHCSSPGLLLLMGCDFCYFARYEGNNQFSRFSNQLLLEQGQSDGLSSQNFFLTFELQKTA